MKMGIVAYIRQLFSKSKELQNKISVLDNVVGIVEYDTDGKISSVNSAFLTMTGHSEEDLVGVHHKKFSDKAFADSEDYSKFWDLLAINRTNASHSGVFMFYGKARNELFINSTFTPVTDSTGKVVKIIQTAMDVTSHKKLEEDCKVFRDCASSIMGIIEYDKTGSILYMNEKARRIFGLPETGHINFDSYRNTISTDDAKALSKRSFWEGLFKPSSDSPFNVKIKRTKKNNDSFIGKSSFVKMVGSNNDLMRVFEYIDDATDDMYHLWDVSGQLSSIGNISAIAEFDMKGNVLNANKNFLDVFGYHLDDVKGKHHSMFVDSNMRNSSEYRTFWDRLRDGEAQNGSYKLIGRSGSELRIQGSYNPILDGDKKAFKVVMFAHDQSKDVLEVEDTVGQLISIDRTIASAEYSTDGKIIKVNGLFSAIFGFQEVELLGQHHSMLVDGQHRLSVEYRSFWERLNRGEFIEGVFKRLDEKGNLVWLKSTYNPVFDADNKLSRIVEFAIDITAQKSVDDDLKSTLIEIGQVLDRVAIGDLTRRIDIENKPKHMIGFCRSLNDFIERVHGLVVSVNTVEGAINGSANIIARDNEDLSTSTAHLSDSLGEITKSMQRILDTVSSTSDSAKRATNMSASAADIAVKGGQVVDNVVNTMTAINQSAKKIEEIITVIDGIAFQTNILALNAAVEAARAGEQGRGFAVVASEVRGLAQRSATAAKEIKELISDSVKKTSEGTVLVEDAGKTMDKIVSSVKQVADIISEISVATVNQTSRINDVDIAIKDMESTTTRNNDLVYQATQETTNLTQHVKELGSSTEVFQVESPEAVIRHRAGMRPIDVNHVSTREYRPRTANWQQF